VIVSIDPGANETGVALWVEETLVYADLARAKKFDGDIVRAVLALIWSFNGPEPDWVAIEIPRVYPMSRSKGDRNTLIDLAFEAGRIVQAIGVPYTCYHPREWKGQVPKEIHNQRVLDALSEAERAVIAKTPASLFHNVVDAVGVGRYHLRHERQQ
jgi:hypothetical protein